MGSIWKRLPVLAAVAWAMVPVPGMASDLPQGVVATVDGTAISQADFNNHFVRLARARFYHGRAPEREVEDLRRDTVDQLILRVLLLREADRRGIPAVEAEVDARMADLRARIAGAGAEIDDGAVADLERQVSEETRIEQIEAMVRDVPPPTDPELAAYYEANQSLFTEPERVRLSLILIGVPPWEPGEAWAQAEEKARSIAADLARGADFATLARTHSTDPSSADGGDMGYIHAGMLAGPAQQAVDGLAVGGTTAPILLLEGWALFRLEDRRSSRLHPLDEVRDRAIRLHRRDAADQAWRRFTDELRRAADIRVAQAAGPARPGEGLPSDSDGGPDE